MANEITFDKLPQAVGYLTEQVERIHKIVAALQPQTTIDKHRIVEIDEACQITRKAKPTIYTLARKGLIPAYKRGKRLYFYEDELLQWIKDGHKPEQALNHQEQAVEIWLQKCVQCYVECKWHLHQYSQGKFGYLYPLLGVQRGRRQLPRLGIIIAHCEFRDELREHRFELLKDFVRFFKEYMLRYGYKHLCPEDDDYKYYQTLNLPCIKRGFMGYHCNYGAPLKDVDV